MILSTLFLIVEVLIIQAIRAIKYVLIFAGIILAMYFLIRIGHFLWSETISSSLRRLKLKINTKLHKKTISEVKSKPDSTPDTSGEELDQFYEDMYNSPYNNQI